MSAQPTAVALVTATYVDRRFVLMIQQERGLGTEPDTWALPSGPCDPDNAVEEARHRCATTTGFTPPRFTVLGEPGEVGEGLIVTHFRLGLVDALPAVHANGANGYSAWQPFYCARGWCGCIEIEPTHAAALEQLLWLT